MLPLFDSKPFHNAICCAFQRSSGGCDIVKAHSANRKRWWPLCVLFMEIKYWERNKKKKKSAGNGGGEDGGGEGEGYILGLMLWSLWKHRQEMQPPSSRENSALLQDVCFTPLHLFSSLLLGIRSACGFCSGCLFVFKLSSWSSHHSGLVSNSLPLYRTPVNSQKLF